jgi:hypothetical protein
MGLAWMAAIITIVTLRLEDLLLVTLGLRLAYAFSGMSGISSF